MTHRWLFAPVVAMTVVAGYLGFQLGQPMTETEIITGYAAVYVEEQGNGAQMIDCLAIPHQRTEVRLVVRCTHPDGTIHTYYAGPRGEPRLPDDPQEPQA